MPTRREWVVVFLGLVLLWGLLGGLPSFLARHPPGGGRELGLLVGPEGLLGVVPTSEAQTALTRCFTSRINDQGVGGAAITIGTTATAVVAATKDRCGFTLINETANPYRCGPTSGTTALTVTTTVGAYIPASVYPVFGQAGAQAWSCIRTGASSAILSVIEDMP